MLHDWQPSASMATLRMRAHFLSNIRHFFVKRGYLEVETPALSAYGVTDRYLVNIHAWCQGQTYYLQTSPEYHMKRLLAAGSGPIFQLARVFRDDELGRWHNPEFTLLEWYQLDIDELTLIAEVDALMQSLCRCPALKIQTYQSLFLNVCGLNPHHASIPALRDVLHEHDLAYVLPETTQDRDLYLFLCMTHLIEPYLKTFEMPVAVIDFPVSQASLARIENGVAKRFEIYYRGVELANGFHELTDPSLQRDRFQSDLTLRKQEGLSTMAIDPRFLAALEEGLPCCSGVALGVDRLFALALEHDEIQSVLAFDFSRA